MSPIPDLPPEAKLFEAQIHDAIHGLQHPPADVPACSQHARAATLSLQVGQLSLRRSYDIEHKIDEVEKTVSMGFRDVKQALAGQHNGNGNGKTVVRPTKKQVLVGTVTATGGTGLLGTIAFIVYQVWLAKSRGGP